REESGVVALQELRANAKRLVGRVADPEHPPVTPLGANAAADLIGKRLEREAVVRRGECTRDPGVDPVSVKRLEKDVDGLLEAALEQVDVSVVRDESASLDVRPKRQVEPVDAVQEEERTDAFVEVVTLPPKPIQVGALRQQDIARGAPAEFVE